MKCDWCAKPIFGDYRQEEVTGGYSRGSGTFCSNKCAEEWLSIKKREHDEKLHELKQHDLQQATRQGGINCSTCSSFNVCWETKGWGLQQRPYFTGLPANGECSIASLFINYTKQSGAARSIDNEIIKARQYKKEREEQQRGIKDGWPAEPILKEFLGGHTLRQPPGTTATYEIDENSELLIYLTGGDSNLKDYYDGIYLVGNYPLNTAIKNIKLQIEAITGKKMTIADSAPAENAYMVESHYHYNQYGISAHDYFEKFEAVFPVTTGKVSILGRRKFQDHTDSCHTSIAICFKPKPEVKKPAPKAPEQTKAEAKPAEKPTAKKPRPKPPPLVTIFCGDCGSKNSSADKFCGDCGSKLD